MNSILKRNHKESIKNLLIPKNISLKNSSTTKNRNKYRLNKSSFLFYPKKPQFNIKYDIFDKIQVFTEKEIIELFIEKCKDLIVPVKDELMYRFMSYIKDKCINRIIDLSDCNLGINSICVLSQILNKKRDFCSRVILAKNDLGDYGIKMLIDQIKYNDYIIELNLSSVNIGIKGGNTIFNYLLNQDSIISLDLSSKEGIYRNRICSEGVKLVENVLQKNIILEKLDLSTNSIKNKGLEYIVNGLKSNISLQTLILSNNEINQKGISYMESNLDSCNLNYLDLSYNPISNEGLISLGNCLSGEQLKEIKYLNVSGCEFFFDSFKSFIKKISKNHQIQTLIFNNNNLCNNNWDRLEDVFKRMAIQNLSLGSCGLGPVIYNIAPLFIRNATIKYLDFSHNQINDKGFENFHDYPMHNISLEEIDFSTNYISDKSASTFFKNLLFNNNIRRLNFCDNHLRSESALEILQVLKRNNSILNLNLKYNIIGVKILKEINKQIYYNKIDEKGKFIPKLKEELKELEFEPKEVHLLKDKILKSRKESEFLHSKLREDIKMYNMKKKINEEEVKSVDFSYKQIEKEIKNCIKKYHFLNEEINNENIFFNKNKKILEDKIILTEKEIKEIKKMNNIINQKLNDEKIILKNEYDKTLYNEQQLMISISSLSKKLEQCMEIYRQKMKFLEKLENTKIKNGKRQKTGSKKRSSFSLNININNDILSDKIPNKQKK